jgi:hypothetical protein
MYFDLKRVTAAVIWFAVSAVAAQATPIMVEMTTTNGVDPLSGVSYTVSDPNGIVRIIFSGSGSSTNGVWAWNNSISEFETAFAQTLTITFASPVPISDLVFGVSSTSFTTGQITLTGSATFADLDVKDKRSSDTGGAATFNPTTGTITSIAQDQGLMLGSDSSDTITALSYFNPASEGGADGYTVYVGFVQGSAAPEPSTGLLLLSAAAALLLGGRRLMRTRLV